MDKAINTLLSHRSFRSYHDKAVEDEKLDTIIRAVQAAPNWCNIQHVSIIVIKDKDRRQRMAELCNGQQHIIQAPVFLVFCVDYYRTFLACRKHGQTLDDIMQDIDHLIIGANEVGIALGTAVAAAELQGLGTVPIGDARMNALEMIKELNLPKYVVPLLGLCVGYPNQDPGLKPRLPKQAVCFEERYNPELSSLLEEYDVTYGEYLQKRPWNNRVSNWTQLVADFYKPPYNHYPDIAHMLKQQGFYSSDALSHK